MGGLLQTPLWPAQVLDYLGRYTHRVAISNDRLLSLDNGKVTFRYKDYKDGNVQKTMTLDADEFIRRFLLHILPSGFVRIRHYGFLANRGRAANLALCRTLLGVADSSPQPSQPELPQDWKTRYEMLTGKSLDVCPACRQGCMIQVEIIPRPGTEGGGDHNAQSIPHETVYAVLLSLPCIRKASAQDKCPAARHFEAEAGPELSSKTTLRAPLPSSPCTAAENRLACHPTVRPLRSIEYP